MQPTTTPPSWTELLEPYAEYLRAAGRPKTTINLRVKQIEKVARELAVAPHEVTTDLLARFMGNPAWADNTRATWRASLAGFFRYAHGTGKLDTNPALLLPTVRVPHGQPKPASDAALEHASLYADSRTALMLALGTRAGLRCMEIAALHHDHIIRESKKRYALRITGKGGKTRTVPIEKKFAKELLIRSRGFIFPGRIDGHISPAYVSKLLSAALPEGVTGHKLRHRFATRAYRGSGHNLRAVQQLLGHSSIATTQVYTEVDNDELRTAALSAS